MRAEERDLNSYLDGIREGSRVILGQAITLIESTQSNHARKAEELLSALLARQDKSQSLRIGISGPPGVGKSTFIESLGLELIRRGHRIAVLAVDPSSVVSGGSILGDKTRMERLSLESNAFIRPSPAGKSLGGVARKTREAITLVEAAGYDIVLIETVGVGQSEIAVHSMTDLFVLLLQPGAGDELQGIKRGIVEMADLLIVNKADGDRVKLANQTRAHYINATHYLPVKPHGQAVRVVQMSAIEHDGVAAVADEILHFGAQIRLSDYYTQHRRQQNIYWWRETIQQLLQDTFQNTPGMQTFLQNQEEQLEQGLISPFSAAEQAIAHFIQEIKKQYGK